MIDILIFIRSFIRPNFPEIFTFDRVHRTHLIFNNNESLDTLISTNFNIIIVLMNDKNFDKYLR